MWKTIRQLLARRKLRRYREHLEHIAETRLLLDVDEDYVRREIARLEVQQVCHA